VLLLRPGFSTSGPRGVLFTVDNNKKLINTLFMRSKTRTDIHSELNIVPANYTYMEEFQVITWADEAEECGFSQEAWGVEEAISTYLKNPANIHGDNDVFRCDVCGARYNGGEIWKHNDGEMISLGYQCARKLHMMRDTTEYTRMKGHLRRVALRKRTELSRKKVAQEFMDAHPGLEEALAVDHRITRDMRANLNRWGSMSDKQIALAFKLQTQEAERAANKEEEETFLPVPVTSERVTLTATILGVKQVEDPFSHYPGAMAMKMLVAVDTEGGRFKLYGSLPKTIEEEAYNIPADLKDCKAVLRGMKIQFDCKFKRSDRDDCFGFISRPTKAKVLKLNS